MLPRDLWVEDPIVVYKNYLKTIPQEVHCRDDRQQALRLFSSTKDQTSELKIHVENGSFHSLSNDAGKQFCCNKITIRNVEKACLYFKFSEKIVPQILDIRPEAVTAEIY